MRVKLRKAKMKAIKLQKFLLLHVVCLGLAAGAFAQNIAPPAPKTGAVVEQGKFLLHKFEQAIGEETYQITKDQDTLTVNVDFKFTDRGSAVPLSVTFKATPDLTPLSFEIKGRTARTATIDEAVEVVPGKIRVRDRGNWTESPSPSKQFFTIAGYAPTAMQMLMVRYWAAHGSPASLITLPGGTVKIVPRGEDNFTIAGRSEKMQRYAVEGLIWGRETLWFDSNQNLVAAITTDAEFDHFEAIREGCEPLLGQFVARAGADGMVALSEISRGISGSHAETFALLGATLIDGAGGPPVLDSAVVIKKGRIVAAGPRNKVKVPKDATVLDEKGKTVLPGLWDMHAHFEQVEWGPIYLAAGVTTVRDCGNEFEFITAVRDAIAQGRGLGPRLLLAGIVDGTGKLALGVQRVDTPEQARAWTDKYHQAGFQQMKIYSSVKLEELEVIAQEAHRLGMTVTGHVPVGLNAYQVIEAGQDQINHLTYIVDIMHAPFPEGTKPLDRLKAMVEMDLTSPQAQKALAFLKAHGTVVDPTIALQEFFTASTAKPTASFEPGVLKVPVELSSQLADVGQPGPYAELREKMFQKQLAVIGMLHRAGIPIVAGTDQTVPGYSLHRELELYVQAGFTPMEAIQAATIVPARVMGFDKELGTVQPGKRADLIVVNGDPLERIQNTRNVEYVITNGVMYNAAELWRSVGFKP